MLGVLVAVLQLPACSSNDSNKLGKKRNDKTAGSEDQNADDEVVLDEQGNVIKRGQQEGGGSAGEQSGGETGATPSPSPGDNGNTHRQDMFWQNWAVDFSSVCGVVGARLQG